MSRTAIATLSTGNLLHNVAVIKNRAPKSKIIAMIKANAYGHGIRSVGMRLEDKVDMLGVASIDEALILRSVGIKTPIILMQGIFEEAELNFAAEEGFHVVFNNLLQIEWLKKQPKYSTKIQAWIKINTGMGRLGFQLETSMQAYQALLEDKNISKPIRVMSHLSCAEDLAHPLNSLQISNFLSFTDGLDTELSLCNSAGIFNFPQYALDYVRPGIALYGVTPIAEKNPSDYNLKPVMTLHSTIITIQKLKKGDCVGYGARFFCPEDMPVGIVAIGYGDGYPINANNTTPVLVEGRLCNLVGRISMDMLAVDLRFAGDIKIGDRVVLWGDGLPVEQVAKSSQTIPWSLLTSVQHRVKFEWI